MEYKVFGRSDVGRVRSNNEDTYFAAEHDGLFLVADGMGGHKAGEVASALTRDVLSSKLAKLDSGTNIEASIREAFLTANESVRNTASTNTDQQGMGCTCVLLMLREQNFFIAHVGDSRVYLFRKGQLKQVTRDHSYVEELFIRGLINEEEKKGHPYRNQITRYIGCSAKLEVDITSGPVWNDDVFLLCSDGLTEEVGDKRIQEIFEKNLEPEAAVNQLIEEALENGGRDNVSVIVVQVTAKKTSFFKKLLGW